MTVTLRYLVNPTSNREELDFRTIGAKYNLDGKEYDYSLHGEAAETGNGSVNTVWTAPGISINAKTLLGGADVVLFDGQWSDYTKVLSPIDGTITFSRTVDGKTERVTVADGQVPSQQDLLVFADGSVRTDTARKALNSPGLTASVDDLMNVGAATASPADDWNASITSSHPGALVPESPGGSIRVSASEAASFALPTPGVSQVLTGSDGVDQVYITPGAVVDARALLGGEDQIFLTGKWEDYTKSLDSGAGIITLTRTVDGHTETVIVGDGQLGANCDLLVFSDGAVRTDTARLVLTQNLAASVEDLTAQGAKTALTADDWTTSTFTRWGVKMPVIDKITDDDKVNASEKHNGVLVTGSAEANSKIELQWGEAHKSVTADAEGKWSVRFDSAEVPGDGPSELSVTATDSTGYISTPAIHDVTVDTVVPAPVIASVGREGYTYAGHAQADMYNDQYVNSWEIKKNFTVKGTAEAGDLLDVQWGSATHQIVVQDDGSWATVFAPTEVPADGTTTLNVKVTDKAGNSAAVTRELIVDTVNPAAATIDAVTGDNVINAQEKADGLMVTGTAEANGSVLVLLAPFDPSYQIGPRDMAQVDSAGHWSKHFTSAELPNGKFEIWALTTDAAGNAQSGMTVQKLTYDTEVAAPAINKVADNDIVNFNEKAAGVSVTGAAEIGSSVKVMWGDAVHTVTADTDGKWSATFDGKEIPADGNTNISAIATDKAGNVSSVGIHDVTVDTVVAAPVINSVADGDVVTAAEQALGVTVTGNAELGSKVDVEWGTGTHIVDVDANGVWSTTFLAAEVPDGTHAITATATDAGGNVSTASTRDVTVSPSVASPALPFTIDPVDLANVKTDGLTVTGTYEANGHIVIWLAYPFRLFGGGFRNVAVDSSGHWSYHFTSAEVPDGTNGVLGLSNKGNLNQCFTHGAIETAPMISNVGTDNIVNDGEKTAGVVVTGTAEAGSKVDVVWGGVEHFVKADNQGAWSSNFTSTEIPANGHTTISAVATDAAGNVSVQVSHDVTVDAVVVAPVTNTVTGDAGVPAVAQATDDTVTGAVGARVVCMVRNAEHTVTTDTDVTANASMTQPTRESVELKPVLSSDVDGAAHFDVRSDIVLKSSQAGHLSDGTWTIKVVNDVNDTSHMGYRGESLDSTQSLTFSVAKGVITDVSGGQVTIGADGKSIVLDPTFDLDLGNKYHIEASAGMFQVAGGGVSDAFNGANFATVSPGVYSPTDTNLGGVLAQKFDENGALVNSQRWVDITGNGGYESTQVSINAGNGDYAFVAKDLSGDDPALGTTAAAGGVTIDGDLNVLLTNFGKSDLLYIDQQDNNAPKNDLTASTSQGGDGHGAPLQYVGEAGGDSQEGMAQVEIQLESGLEVSSSALVPGVSDIHSTTGVVISG